MDFVSVANAMGTFGQGGVAGQGGAGSGLTAFLPLIIMVVIFYFLLIRPQQKKQKEHKSMLDNLKKGDTVVTQGGLLGKITGMTDKVLTLEIADKVRVKVHRGYVASVEESGGEVSE